MFDSPIAITLAIYLISAFHSFLLIFLNIFSAQLQRGLATALKFKKHNSSQARTQATRTSRSPKAHIALWIRCSRISIPSFTTEGGRLHQSARIQSVPLKPASFTTEGERLHKLSFTCYERLHQSARTQSAPLKPASFTTEGERLHKLSFTTEGGRLHQSHAQIASR